jgi:uncharacterized membrane protein
MSIVFALVAALAWGAADYLGGLHAKKHDLLVVTLSREFAGFLFFVVLLIFTGGSPEASDIVLGLGIGVILGVALPVFFSALASGRMAVVAPVAGSVGAAVPIVVGVVSGERLTYLQAGGLSLAVVAIVCVSIQHVHHEGVRKRHVELSDLLTDSFCGVAFGAFFVGMHHTSAESGFWPSASVTVGVMGTLGVWAMTRRSGVLRQLRPSTVLRFGVGGVLDGVAAAAFLLATRDGLLAVTAGVASLYPVATAGLAAWLLKEHLHRVNALGLALCGTSLALVAV